MYVAAASEDVPGAAGAGLGGRDRDCEHEGVEDRGEELGASGEVGVFSGGDAEEESVENDGTSEGSLGLGWFFMGDGEEEGLGYDSDSGEGESEVEREETGDGCGVGVGWRRSSGEGVDSRDDNLVEGAGEVLGPGDGKPLEEGERESECAQENGSFGGGWGTG